MPAMFLLLLADPRRPYPQDVEMRSGFLGGFSVPPPQPEQGKLSTDLAPSEPPEKKMAIESNGAIVLQGCGVCCVCVSIVHLVYWF